MDTVLVLQRCERTDLHRLEEIAVVGMEHRAVRGREIRRIAAARRLVETDAEDTALIIDPRRCLRKS
ncbi:MAG: hypothetical protein R3D05_19120 [Dongiaceae bacterium]